MTTSIYGIMKKGIIDENPTFVQLLALCPLLAVTTSAINGITMGLATTAIMICASTVISIVRKLLPSEIRIAAAVVIIAGFVTALQLLLDAYAPPHIVESLGIFIPLIVVNCILFARVEIFASKHNPFLSAVDALAFGLGFTLGLFTVGVIREFFGTGSVLGFVLIADTTSHVLVMIMAPGAFFTLGLLIMVLKYFRNKKAVNS